MSQFKTKFFNENKRKRRWCQQAGGMENPIRYDLNMKCPHRLMCLLLSPHLVVLFWEVVETWEGRVLLEKVGPRGLPF
jgi:hypothetical protein